MKKFRKRPQAIPHLKSVSENKDKSTTGCETGSGLDGQPCKSYFPNNVQGKHSWALHGFIIDFSAIHAGKKASGPEKFIEKKFIKCYFSEEDTETTEFSGGGRFERRKGSGDASALRRFIRVRETGRERRKWINCNSTLS
ncbi:hypothetical protein [uncultured Victivallis sp.]|uniref:hypothetical protein n=1 Tax=uncultured Victivallis sp. TaxID=354118 RepID=UPI0025D5D39F|nr:hypothetical protein [uncultured Victivallis sp.]